MFSDRVLACSGYERVIGRSVATVNAVSEDRGWYLARCWFVYSGLTNVVNLDWCWSEDVHC